VLGIIPGAVFSIEGQPAYAGVLPWTKEKPDLPSVARLMTVAKLFERQRQTQRALDAYRAVLEQQPDHAAAREKVDALQAQLAREANQPETVATTPSGSGDRRSVLDKAQQPTAGSHARVQVVGASTPVDKPGKSVP